MLCIEALVCSAKFVCSALHDDALLKGYLQPVQGVCRPAMLLQ